MKATTWITPVSAEGCRSLELLSLAYAPAAIDLRVAEETGKHWRISFLHVQAMRVTTFESAFVVMQGLPDDGALFEWAASEWLESLGRGRKAYMDKARHFVVSCYDQVVEVVAWDVEFEELPSGKA